MSCLNDEAPANISERSALPIFPSAKISLSKLVAPANMLLKLKEVLDIKSFRKVHFIGWSNDSAPANNFLKLLTLRTSHAFKSWLNAFASSKTLSSLVRWPSGAIHFHLPIGASNFIALLNIEVILFNESTFQFSIPLPSYASADENIQLMFSTLLTSHALISALNFLAWLNIELKLVKFETFNSGNFVTISSLLSENAL